MLLTNFITNKIEDKNIEVCQKNFWYMLNEILNIYESETQYIVYFSEDNGKLEELNEYGFISEINLYNIFCYFENYFISYIEEFSKYMIDNSINTLDNFEEFINIF